MRTLDEAIALLKADRLLMLAPHPPLRSLVEEIGGPGITGNWWGHAAGGLIFKLSSDLADHPDTLVVKLVAGKVTYVHRSLWPALLRVAVDPSRRAERLVRSTPDARALYERVAVEGCVRAEKSDKVARLELEKSLLVLSQSEHTDRGHHETVLSSWERWAISAGAVVSSETFDREIAELSLVARCVKLPI